MVLPLSCTCCCQLRRVLGRCLWPVNSDLQMNSFGFEVLQLLKHHPSLKKHTSTWIFFFWFNPKLHLFFALGHVTNLSIRHLRVRAAQSHVEGSDVDRVVGFVQKSEPAVGDALSRGRGRWVQTNRDTLHQMYPGKEDQQGLRSLGFVCSHRLCIATTTDLHSTSQTLFKDRTLILN